MPKIPEYGAITAEGLDDNDQFVMDIDGVTKNILKSEVKKTVNRVDTASSSGPYTLVLTDEGKMLEKDDDVTVPNNSTVAFAIGASVMIVNSGAGAFSILAAGGVTLDGTTTVSVGGSVVLVKKAPNTWRLLGGGSGGGGGSADLGIIGAQTATTTRIDISFNKPVANTAGFTFTKNAVSYVSSGASIVGADNVIRFTFTGQMLPTDTLAYSYSPGTIEDTDGNPFGATSGNILNTLSGTISGTGDAIFII